jgi:hypothetical protein
MSKTRFSPLLVMLIASQTSIWAQGGRQGAAQTPPTTTTPAPQATPGGRGGRGGVSGPGPAVGGEVDETPVVTKHSITVQGKTLNYTATVA